MSQDMLPTMPGFRDVGVPSQFRDHPLLNAGPYFTLPLALLNKVVEHVGQKRFDADLLAMENALSDVSGNHSNRIGFWGGQPINFLLLRPMNDWANEFTLTGMSQWVKTEHEAREILKTSERRLDWSTDARRGYCGWLMTNQTFLAEHWQIFQAWKNEVSVNGIPSMGPVVRDAKSIPGAKLAKGKLGEFVQAFEEFFVRWRLDSMPAPFVPRPMAMQVPVLDLRAMLGHMRQGGTTFYVPDICPVPSRDDLREIIEQGLRTRNAPSHLKEWFELVNADSVTKNQIPRYGRVFETQHYVRALHARHSAALNRKKSALILALSEFFNVSDDTVERDFTFIGKRLGKEWYLAAPQAPATPTS